MRVFHEDHLFYDEPKQRFIYEKEAPHWQQRRLTAPFFKQQRPDFTELEYRQFQTDLHMAHRYMRHLASQNKNEMKRMFMVLPQMCHLYLQPLADEYLRKTLTDKPKANHLWTWDDATRMVNLYRSEIARAAKYGLDIPHIHGDGGMSKKELKAKEEDLTNYFLYEMKKAPKAK